MNNFEELLNKNFNIKCENIDYLCLYHISTLHSNVKNKEIMIAWNNLSHVGNNILSLICETSVFLYRTQNQIIFKELSKNVKESFVKKFLYKYKNVVDVSKHINGKDITYDFLAVNILGMSYLINGFNETFELFKDMIMESISENSKILLDTKSKLLEWAQNNRHKVEFKVVDQKGPDNDSVFSVRVNVNNKIAYGEGKTKVEAEKNAAYNLVNQYGWFDLYKIVPKEMFSYKPTTKKEIPKSLLEIISIDNALISDVLMSNAYMNEKNVSFNKKQFITIVPSLFKQYALDSVFNSILKLYEPVDAWKTEANFMQPETLYRITESISLYEFIIKGKGDIEAGRKALSVETFKIIMACIFLISVSDADEIKYVKNVYSNKLQHFIDSVSFSKNSSQNPLLDSNTDYISLLNQFVGNTNWNIGYDVKEVAPTKFSVKLSVHRNDELIEMKENRQYNSIKDGKKAVSKKFIEYLEKITFENIENGFYYDLVHMFYMERGNKFKLKIHMLFFKGKEQLLLANASSFKDMLNLYSFFLENNVLSISEEDVEKLIDSITDSNDITTMDGWFRHYPELLTEKINEKVFELISKI